MPTLEPFFPRDVAPKPWGREILIAHLPFATGKLLIMRAGTSGPLQYHERKHEAFYLYEGEADVSFDPGEGLVTRRMHPGDTYVIPPGAVHRVSAVSDCVMFEISNPVFDDRVNVEAQYA